MREESDAKRTKNFKDIKRSIVNSRPFQNENTPHNNLDDSSQPSLTFKRLNTNRDQEQGFSSPTKVFTIDTHPIDNIDLSSQKKKQHFLKYKPSSYKTKESKTGITRNDSTNSNKSDSSYKKSLYSQFSQLAEASSQEKKIKAIPMASNNLCFNQLEVKGAERNIPRRSVLTAQSPSTPVKQSQKPLQSILPKSPTPRLKKHQSHPLCEAQLKEATVSAVPKSPQRAQSMKQPPAVLVLKPSESESDDEVEAVEYAFAMRGSILSIVDSVRVSISLESMEDMSPFI